VGLPDERRTRLADLALSNAQQLPRVFHPSPTAEWSAWTVTLCIFGAIGALFAGFVIYDGFKSSTMDLALFIFPGIGVLGGLLAAWYARSSLVTVRIDSETISYAKGRGELQWITARWAELKHAAVKSQTHKGTTTQWVELIFPDSKTRKIPSDVIDYPLLRDMVLELYSRRHQPV
jgi:hypothetical protein